MKLKLICSSLLACIPSVTFAAAMVPGMWTLSMTVVGTGKRNAPQVATQCVSQNDVEHPVRALPRPAGACTLTNVKRDDNGATYDLACINGATQAQGRANIKFGGDRYEGQVIMAVTEHGSPAQMTVVKVEARRTGECPAK